MKEYWLIETKKLIAQEDYFLFEPCIEKNKDVFTQFIQFIIKGLERL